MENEQGPGRRMRSLRLSETDLARAERLCGVMGADAVYRAVGEMSQSRVLQVAIVEGLAVLEARYGRPRPVGPSAAEFAPRAPLEPTQSAAAA